MAGNCTCRDCPIVEITSEDSHRTAAGADTLDCNQVGALGNLELGAGIRVEASAWDKDAEERSLADDLGRRQSFPELCSLAALDSTLVVAAIDPDSDRTLAVVRIELQLVDARRLSGEWFAALEGHRNRSISCTNNNSRSTSAVDIGNRQHL